MALYSSNLKTYLVDAVRDIKKRRVEFRLDKVDCVYTSNIRILNIGVEATGASQHYNILLGGLGIIKSIQILDGKKVLDKLDNFADWVSFKHQLNTNDENRDINNEMFKNALGFTHGDINANKNAIVPEYDNVVIAQNDNDNNAVLYLSKYLNFLKEARILPTQIFQNLSVIIDYTTDYANVSTAADINDTVEPVLAVDEIYNEEQAKALVSQFKEVQWEAIESDMVYLSNVATQPNANYTIKGFDGGKLLNRLLVQRKPTSVPNSEVGRVGSTAMSQLKEQFVINGRNKLPGFNGIEDNNERLGLLIDTFGEINVLPGSNQVSIADSANTHVQTCARLIGNQSYTGLIIGEKVDELQYQMKRSVATAPASEANNEHNINFFGEVSKGLMVKGASDYDVVYL